MGPCQLQNIGHGTMAITKHDGTWDHGNYKTLDMEPCQLQNIGHGSMSITKHWTWNHGKASGFGFEHGILGQVVQLYH